MVPEGYVLLDRQGKLIEMVFTDPLVRVPASYRPPSNEERRALARKAVEDACGPIPARLLLAETSGGDLGAFYTATWKRLRAAGHPAWAEVSLLQEKVTRLKCSARTWEPMVLPPPMLKYVVGLFLLWGLVRLLTLFATGQCHRSPIFWNRLPWAVLLGVAGGWVVLPSFFVSPPSLPVRLAAGLAASSLLLVGLVAVEHHLRRRAPAGIASYALALRGRFRESAVALAVVRGALVGLVLMALETFLAYLGLVRGRLIHGRLSLAHFSTFLDPTPVGYALASFSPALFAVSSALFHGFLLGLILLGLGWVQSFVALRKAKKWKTVQVLAASPVYVFLGIAGLPLHVGVFDGMFFGFFLYSLVWALALGWLVVRYDLLTAVIAVATATLWALNYPLLYILRDIGNEAHWGIFAGWFALILLAAMTAFRSRLVRALKAESE